MPPTTPISVQQIQSLKTNAQPTQFEEDRTPGAYKRFAYGMGNSAMSMARGIPTIAAAATGDVGAGVQIGTGITNTVNRKDLTPLEKAGTLAGGLDVDAIKAAAASGDTAGIWGNVTIPLGLATAGLAPAARLGMARMAATRAVEAPEALNAMIQGGTKAADTFETAKVAAPELKQAAESLGVAPDTVLNRIKQAVGGSATLRGRAGNQAIRDVVDTAISTNEAKAQGILQPVAAAPFDGAAASQNLRAKITPELREFAPDYANALDEQASKLGKARTLGEADEARVVLNDIAQKFYSQSDLAQASDLKTSAAMAEAADELRGTLYDQVQQLTGRDMRSIRATESSLMKVKGRMSNHLNKVSGEQSVYSEPSVAEDVRNAGGAAHSLGSDFYRAAMKRTGLRQAPVERANAQFGKVIR